MAQTNPMDMSRRARSGVIGVDSEPPDLRILYCRRCVDTHEPSAGSFSYRFGTRQCPFSVLYRTNRLNMSSHLDWSFVLVAAVLVRFVACDRVFFRFDVEVDDMTDSDDDVDEDDDGDGL